MASPNPELCLAPTVAAPNGRYSNFVDPPTLAPVMVAVMSTLVEWATIFVVIWFCMTMRRLSTSDYFSTIALATSITITGISFTEELKTFRHIWDVPACYFDAFYARNIYIGSMLLNMGCFFAKTSIFLLFFQIFAVHKPMRYAILFGLACCLMLYGVGVVVASIFETPHDGGGWVKTIGTRSLIPLHWWQAQAALIVTLDFYIFILPLPAVYRLNAPLRRRVAIAAVFSLALMVIGASIASLVERIKIKDSIDDTWIKTILTLCSAAELNVAIIVGCAPSVAHFGKNTLPTLNAAKTQLSSLLNFGSRTQALSHLTQPASAPSANSLPNAGIRRYTVILEELELQNSPHHHPSDTVWEPRNHVTVDQNGKTTNHTTNVTGILRTMAIEQETSRIDEEAQL